ncbi:MAG: hypothetical protein KAS32_13375 [Candidatus Peribacteraceae bacterium]|nr:hypothetical protein [Candidatus Peribacteraceae bacterium]
MGDWPPSYTKILLERQNRFLKLQEDPSLIIGAKAFYKGSSRDFINDWCVTYDPRNAQNDLPTTMPFITFERQDQFISFLLACLADQEAGLVEKSRDIGATWLSCAFSIWLWLFVPGAAVGWGSRKEALVDKIGDPDSIFEKMRIIINYLPRFFWPVGFDLKKHATYMRIINPENGATITGEAGDNIGRGGRKLLYFKDESAHYERPERIEAALADNTNVQIDISSVHGTANIFARRRQAGAIWEPGKEIALGTVRVFIFDWRDHPAKDQEWYDRRQKKAESEGLAHVFAQEVDRDYSAAVEGVVIPQKWVKAAIDAHLKLDFDDEGMAISALDVATGEGHDKHAYIMRKGVILLKASAWGSGDTGETTRKAVTFAKRDGCKNVQFDVIGVGSGVKAEANRLEKDGALNGIIFIPWNAAAKPLRKEQRMIKGDKNSPLNKDFFANLKAQGGWQLRLRFEKTYNAIVHGTKFDSSELISISSRVEHLHRLVQELSQATYTTDGKGRIVINKKPSGASSPDLADGTVMCYWPVQMKRILI